jgi:hypothetical protein
MITAFAAPFLFKGKFISLAKNELNKTLNARADFRDVDISFFRSFPRLSVALEGLQITGIDNFSKDTLLSAKKIDIAVNFYSIFNTSDIQVYSIKLDEPRIHAIVLKDGRANWDIVKDKQEEPDAEDGGHFQMELKKYAVHNGYLEYRDEEGNMYAELKDINHVGSGNLGSEKYTLSTTTSTGSTTFHYDGIPYLVNAVANIDADLDIDAKQQLYQFTKASARVNDLTLNSDGNFQLINDSTYGMDIRFDAPAVDFKSILSLIPAIYKNDFAAIKTSGKAVFNGIVKGRYSNSEIPAYKINLDIKDGYFQYPDLPKPVKNISLSLLAENPDGIMDHTVIDIRNGHIEMDKMPFDFRLLLKKPMTDRYIDGAVKGRLDLSQVARYVKLEPGTKLSGILDADIEGKGNLAVIQQQVPGDFSARGYIDINELFYASASFPQPIQHTSARIIVENPDGVADNTVINIPSAHLEVGKDIADLSLLIKNPATDPRISGKAKGTMNLENIKQFYAFDPGTNVKGTLAADLVFNGSKSQIEREEYQSVELSGLVTGKDIRYTTNDYPDGLAISNAGLRFTPRYVQIDQLDGEFEKTKFSTTGTFDNLLGYAMKDEPLKGTLNIMADKIDLNKWMGTDTASSSSSSAGQPFPVPGNVDFTVNAKASQVHYDKVDYSAVTGKLLVRDEKVQLSNITMNALDGSITMDGYYSTKQDKLHPEISFNYDVKNLDVQKTFMAFNTVQKLMPAAQFISGKLNSQLTMKGMLGADMMPDLSSLTGNGNLLLLEGFLNKFAPLDKMASSLNISELQGISLKDVKNYFAFANGKVLVKPFHMKVKGIDMEIGGLHGIDQSIDYQVNMKVPRALMGNKGNEYLDKLALQASNTGVPVKLNDVVNLTVKMGGSILNPVMTTDLRQSTQALADDLKKQASDFVQTRADSTKKATRDSAIVIRDKLVSDTRDALISQLSGTKDSSGKKGFIANDSKKRVEKAGSDLFKNVFKKKKPADSTNR